jgi:NAD(P)-dependent dehydrogenase (short-subunit alcohol dehydrogenase family)
MGGSLDGERALVVGGSSGIGLGSARRLARDGAHGTIAGRTETKLHAAQAELAAEGSTLRSRVATRSTPDQCAAIFDGTID